jgi:hypothetical protein
MQDAIGGQVGFVVGVDGFEQNPRNYFLKFRHQRRHRHHCGKEQIDRADQNYQPGANQEIQRIHSAQRQPGAKHKQKLPGERVEIPNSGGIGGQVPASLPDCEVKQHGGEHDYVAVP